MKPTSGILCGSSSLAPMGLQQARFMVGKLELAMSLLPWSFVKRNVLWVFHCTIIFLHATENCTGVKYMNRYCTMIEHAE
jgi:hypothetical protein